MVELRSRAKVKLVRVYRVDSRFNRNRDGGACSRDLSVVSHGIKKV